MRPSVACCAANRSGISANRRSPRVRAARSASTPMPVSATLAVTLAVAEKHMEDLRSAGCGVAARHAVAGKDDLPELRMAAAERGHAGVQVVAPHTAEAFVIACG